MDSNQKWVLMAILIIIMSISAVSANEVNVTDSQDTTLVKVCQSENTPLNSLEKQDLDILGDNSKLPDTPVKPDSPDLVLNETIYIDSTNIDEYFTDGILQQRCSNKTLVFSGSFENIGKLVIGIDNVTIRGAGSNFKNTILDVSGNNCTISDLNIDLDSEYENNEFAGIYIDGDDVKLDNININYITPKNIQAYGIYAVGSSQRQLKNLRIANSQISFEGHNDDVGTYNCAVKFVNCKDAIFENNTIVASLPLKDVNFGPNGATLDSDLVLAAGIESCINFTFRNNNIFCDVNKRPAALYPTLDCVLISKTDNSTLINNSIYMTDFITHPGTDNYLYGLDIYNLNNLTVTKNNINIVTTGGKLAAGTAYPIQITGPISGVNITDNDLYSFSNGPNIGVYSQNYYGKTALSITNNRINVTGLAGVHEWALVAGIESQDSDSIIRNNTIEVHSVGDVNVNDNIYGISYRQSTSGNHSFDIEDNTVFSDGYYAVFLLSSIDSTIINNLLVSYNKNVDGSSNGYNYGDLSSHLGDTFYNNRVITILDYLAGTNNNVDGGEEFDYETPINNEGISNVIDGSSILGRNDDNSFSYNPLIPGSHKNNGNQEGSGIIDNSGSENQQGNPSEGGNSPNGNSSEDGDNGNSHVGPVNGEGTGTSGSLTLRDLLLNYMNSNTDGGDVNITSYDGKLNNDVVSNNTDATPSLEGEDALMSESKLSTSDSSVGQSESAMKKAYELEDLSEENEMFIPSIMFVIAAMILLIVGYKRRKTYLE